MDNPFQSYCDEYGITDLDIRWFGLSIRMDENADVPIDSMRLADDDSFDRGLSMLDTYIMDANGARTPSHNDTPFKDFCEQAKTEVEKWVTQEMSQPPTRWERLA